ncbi:AraC family transcriptional regulator [Pseudomonas sp. NPDC087697]|uniref:AraC family transcriptional regulator n=1 Tax=Pseudomonas sp. NPDC087697 TaxID=3364447 RepID=UPI003813D44E
MQRSDVEWEGEAMSRASGGVSSQADDLILSRSTWLPANTVASRAFDERGEFIYSFSGLLEVEVEGFRYLVPHKYGVWLPPGIRRSSFNRQHARHISIYLPNVFSALLPAEHCALEVDTLLRSLLEGVSKSAETVNQTDAEKRLLRVLVDRFMGAKSSGSYLPHSADPQFGPLLTQLKNNPYDQRSFSDIAVSLNVSERTLARRCQRDLGMTFLEWRQRLLVVESLALLQQGQTVEAISLVLGYKNTSSFISMFRKLTNMTPNEYRREEERCLVTVQRCSRN